MKTTDPDDPINHWSVVYHSGKPVAQLSEGEIAGYWEEVVTPPTPESTGSEAREVHLTPTDVGTHHVVPDGARPRQNSGENRGVRGFSSLMAHSPPRHIQVPLPWR